MDELYQNISSVLNTLRNQLTYFNGLQIIRNEKDVTFQDDGNNELFKITGAYLLEIISNEIPYSLKGLQIHLKNNGIHVHIQAPV